MKDFNEHTQQQAQEGRSKLHLRNGASRRTEANKTVTKFAKGHDAVLKGMQDNNSLATISMMSGESFTGKVLNRDRYTITLEVSGKKRVIYKHAIEFFEESANDSNASN